MRYKHVKVDARHASNGHEFCDRGVYGAHLVLGVCRRCGARKIHCPQNCTASRKWAGGEKALCEVTS